jgi:uncharacterized membrane protein
VLDKQDVIAIIIILFGLGLTQLDKGSNSFYLGLGIGTVIMASVWVIIRIIKEFKKK